MACSRVVRLRPAATAVARSTRAGPAGPAGPAPRVFAAHAASTPACVRARAFGASPGARAPARWLVDARGSSPRSSAVSRASPSRGGGGGGGGGGAPRAPSRRAPTRARAVSTTASSDVDASTQYVPGANHADLSKNFEHADVEERLYSWWESRGCFAPDPDATGEPFTIAMPPPNVTGALHMGHAMFVTLQDIMARNARMRGRPTLWLPGSDHAGIATQLVVERALEAEGKTRVEIGREAFEERTWAWKEEYGGRIAGQIRRLGASCDWSRERFTLDEGLSDAVLEAFVSLHERGLIYKGTYMVNWAPKLQTAVSDLEVEYADEPGTLYYFKYPVRPADGDEEAEDLHLPVATSRPETILGDTAVAVNPNDPRFARFIGRECVVPFSDPPRFIPIIGDEYVDVEFGTGALKVTPGHDPNDYEIGKRRGLPTINIMNKDGSMNAKCGPAYEGMDRTACREQLWRDMEANGLAIRTEAYQTRVPRSQRGGEVIEPLVSEQWFCKMDSMAAPALAAVESGELTIVPPRFEKIYRGWLGDIRDWCISRQLWWGHRIPVWYVHESEEALARARSGEGAKGSSDVYVVARSEEEARAKHAASAGVSVDSGFVLYQEEDVLDTWFSSGLWPFSTLGWPDEDAEDFKKFFPTAVMETGHDILFFWVARMVMLSYGMTGKLPFHTVFLHGLVRDEKGRKMSKSLGNVVDPLEVIEAQGCDALRFTLATGTAPGQDLNLNMDRLASNRNFTNKIWNAGKFVLYAMEGLTDEERCALAAEANAFETTDPNALAALPTPEAWIISRLHETVDRVTAAHDRYDFGEAGRAAYSFFYDDFADWFIEGAKSRLYGDDAAAKRTALAVTLYVMERTLRVLHPFVPYVTEEVWRALPRRGETLMNQPWPTLDAASSADATKTFEALRAVVRSVRNARAEYAVEPAKRVPAHVVVKEEEEEEGSSTLLASLGAELGMLAGLARLDEATSSVAASPPEAAAADPGAFVQCVVSESVEVWLPLSGIVDPAKETERLGKQRAKLEKEAAGLAGRLASPAFAEKAPAAVVEKSRKELQELQEQLQAVETRMEQMAALL